MGWKIKAGWLLKSPLSLITGEPFLYNRPKIFDYTVHQYTRIEITKK